MQHIWLSLIICVIAAFYPFAVFPDNQENLRQLRDRIRSLQNDLNDKEVLRQQAADALKKTERIIGDVKQKLNQLKDNNRLAVEEYQRLQAQYDQTRDAIQTEQNRLRHLLYQQYVGPQPNHLRLIFNQQNSEQNARDAYYYRQISLARSMSIRDLQQSQKEIQGLKESSRQKKEEIAAIQAEYFDQYKKLEQEKNKYQTLYTQVSDQISRQQKDISDLESDEKRLANLVAEIGKLLVPEKHEKFLVNSKLPDGSTSGIPFSALKGKLNLPVRGKLASTFGSLRSGSHMTWKGLFIQSSKGSDVKAVSDGRIMFADWLRGFGNLIILDHGNNYMSLYGNNATLYKQVGDTVRGGDTIATVGNSSDNGDTGLYFELRHRSKPFDPMAWIKIE